MRRYLLIQIDGLSHGELTRALQAGELPDLQAEITGKRLNLIRARAHLPTNTLNFYSRLFFSEDVRVPGSRWYHRNEKRVYDIRFSRSLNRIERKLAASFPPRTHGMALFGTLLGREAVSLGFVRSSFQAANLIRTARILAGAAAVNILKWNGPVDFYLDTMKSVTRTGVRRVLRAIPAYPDRHFLINLMLYDQVAHKAGLKGEKTLDALKTSIRHLHKLVEAADRHGLEPVIFSDHGMAPSVPFHSVEGKSLRHFLVEVDQLAPRDFRILPSGNIVHLYIPHFSASDREKFARAVSRRESIGTATAPRNPGEPSIFVEGEPLKSPGGIVPDGNEIDTIDLRELAKLPGSGDIVLTGAAVNGEAVNFMNQHACHNGYILGQTDAFLMTRRPPDLELDTGIVKALSEIASPVFKRLVMGNA